MNDIVLKWNVDDKMKHAIMIDNLSKNVEQRISKEILTWIN